MRAVTNTPPAIRFLGLVLMFLGLVARPTAAKLPSAAPSGTLQAAPAPVLEIESFTSPQTSGGVVRQYGAQTGILRRYFRRQPGAGFKAAGSPERVAEQFLLQHARELGLAPERLASDLKLRYAKQTPSGVHLRYDQLVDGVPVYRGEVVVKVAQQGDVSSVHNNLHVRLPAGLGRAGLDATAARARALQVVLPRGPALGEYTSELAVVQYENGTRLTWLVSIPASEPMGDWYVFVDAQNGSILGIEDRMLQVDGTGRVFDPDPLAVSGNPSLPDNNDADSGIPFPAAYVTRTLRDLTDNGGIYSLTGPYVSIQELEAPISTPVTSSDPDAFLFTRSQQGFEDVNVYFHLDQSQRYIQNVLGITNANNRVQPADPHGLNGVDNSHYVIGSGILAFGEGGVDDAEDADVVLHEYGHALQHDMVPGWGGGQEGQMGEGFGDYWAGSYSWSLFPNFQEDWVFNWDGHNQFWAGRVLVDSTKHYPRDCCGQVHTSGTLWCSGLTTAMRAIGRTTMDQLVIDHHFALGTTATMADAANQIIQSDIDLNGGANLQALVEHFDFWGFVDAALFIPQIVHTPLSDTEDATGPYPVAATITAAAPLDATKLRVIWGVGALTDTLLMAPAGPPGQFVANIPGPLSNVTVHYYITAGDSSGANATDPAGAPASFHAFSVGGDTQPPVIVHAPLGDQLRLTWPASIMATITDNIGVDDAQVNVEWSQNDVVQTSFALARIGVSDQFIGIFPSDTTLVAVGDTITYRLRAQDTAATPNVATHPAIGTHAFAIIDPLGTVLVLDDDELASSRSSEPSQKRSEAKAGDAVPRDPAALGKSAQDLCSTLSALGYLATLEAVTSSNPTTWGAYSFIVSSSGGNEDPVADVAYRDALEAYVSAGGKLLIEGGEVAYDAASSPGYLTFATNVLHTIDWDDDNAGSLQLLAGQSGHPIATTPNLLPATLPINYTGYGSEDSYKPLAPAFIVYGVTEQAGNGGILVYDESPAPQSGQIVFYGFDFKDLADTATRTHLLQNTAAYLLAHEPTPTGSISGTVRVLGAIDNSGVTLTLTPGGNQVVTGAYGTYAFASLYPGSYAVTAAKTGFQTTAATAVPVSESTNTGGVDLTLYPRFSAVQCDTVAVLVPDATPAGVSRNLAFADSFVVTEVEVQVNITHPYIENLIVELTHGPTTVRLHDQGGGATHDIIGTYPTTLLVSGPGSLDDFAGSLASGTWSLKVADLVGSDVGTLNAWCLNIWGQADSSIVTDVGPRPQTPTLAVLQPGQPNPAFGGVTQFRFALPASQRVELVIYDVAGRLVRTLVQGPQAAGQHLARWDGLDAAQRPVASGVYFSRLVTAETQLTRKLVVLR